jgi:hypothetical protein
LVELAKYLIYFYSFGWRTDQKYIVYRYQLTCINYARYVIVSTKVQLEIGGYHIRVSYILVISCNMVLEGRNPT